MPATEMYTMLLRTHGRDYWREHIANGTDEPIPRPLCDLTDEEIQRWTRVAYLRFYYRPSFIMKSVSRLKSRDEFIRSAKTAWQMLLNPPSEEGMEVVG
jgi:hypothetical protein